jgi:PadR family transcriptional regulator, regulatory protein PadR
MTNDEMREPTFLLLTALAVGRRHGYALIEDVARLSAGRLTLRPGSLYAALDRLTTEGMVAIDGEEVVSGRLRRYFALTDLGVARLSERAAELAHTSAEAHRLLSARQLRTGGATA